MARLRKGRPRILPRLTSPAALIDSSFILPQATEQFLMAQSAVSRYLPRLKQKPDPWPVLRKTTRLIARMACPPSRRDLEIRDHSNLLPERLRAVHKDNFLNRYQQLGRQ